MFLEKYEKIEKKNILDIFLQQSNHKNSTYSFNFISNLGTGSQVSNCNRLHYNHAFLVFHVHLDMLFTETSLLKFLATWSVHLILGLLAYLSGPRVEVHRGISCPG